MKEHILCELMLMLVPGFVFQWLNTVLPKEASAKIPLSQLLVTVLRQLLSHLQIPVSDHTTSDTRINNIRMVQSCRNYHYKY